MEHLDSPEAPEDWGESDYQEGDVCCAGPPEQCCHELQHQQELRQNCAQGGAQLTSFQLQQRLHQGVHGLHGGLLQRLDLTQLVVDMILCLRAPYVYENYFI